MIDGAKRAVHGHAASVAIEVAGDSESVVVRAPTGAMPGTDAVALANSCGGTLVLRDGWTVFALPSLAYLRRAGRAEEGAREGAMPTRASGS